MNIVDFLCSVSFGEVADFISFITFFVSISTLIIASKIKNKFLFRYSIEEHKKEIHKISKDITTLLQDYNKNEKEINELFALADVELRAMEKGSSENLLDDIKKSRRAIKKYGKWFFIEVKKDEESARKIKTSLSIILAEISHHEKILKAGN